MRDVLLFLIHVVLVLVLVHIAVRMLIQFGVMNGRHPVARTASRYLSLFVEPMLRPIARVVPTVGPFDLSPLVLFILLQLLAYLVVMVVPA